jgi:hypothetical protein
MEAVISSSLSLSPSHADSTETDSQERPVRERKVVHNASSKVSLVVQRMLFPLLDTPMRTHVVFDVELDQAELDLMDQLGRNKPEVLEDPKTFVQHLQGLYDRYKQGFSVPCGKGYDRVSTSSLMDPLDSSCVSGRGFRPS